MTSVIMIAPLNAENFESGNAADGQVLTSEGDGRSAWRNVPAPISDHGALSGLSDDDHSQYALADGSRGSFATVSQGSKADSAVQPGANATVLGSGTELTGKVLTANGTSGSAWSSPLEQLPVGARIPSTITLDPTKYIPYGTAYSANVRQLRASWPQLSAVIPLQPSYSSGVRVCKYCTTNNLIAAVYAGSVWIVLASGSRLGLTCNSSGTSVTNIYLPQPVAWVDVAWNGTVACAIASNTTVAATSPEGTTWTERALPVAANWQSVAWNGSVFTAVAYGSSIAATSADGITWTQQVLPVSANWIKVVAVGSTFVAIATDSAIAATSTDGITWTQQTLPVNQHWVSLTASGTTFLAVANTASAATSTDGINWTLRTLPSAASWETAAWNGTVFSIHCTGLRHAFTSPDGITWTQRYSGYEGNSHRCFGRSGSFLMLSSSGVSESLSRSDYVSTDGITWTSVTLRNTGIFATSITGNSTGTIIVATGTRLFMVSLDFGLTWTEVLLPVAPSCVGYNGTVFLTIVTTTAYTSSDGITWNRTAADPTNITPGAIVGNPATGQFCITGTAGNKNLLTVDGSSWTLGTMPSSTDWSRLCWNGFVWCAVQTISLNAAVSSDGVSWTAKTLPISISGTTYGAIANVGRKLIALGYTNTASAISNDDGVTWVIQPYVTSGDNIRWSIGNASVLIRAASAIAHWSTDGITWTAVTGTANCTCVWMSPTGVVCIGISNTNGIFVSNVIDPTTTMYCGAVESTNNSVPYYLKASL